MSNLESEVFSNSFESLQSLDISFNRFGLIPDALHQMTALQYFNASHNLIELDFTPDKTALYHCKDLRVLDLSYNRIRAVGPPFFDTLKNLSRVFLGGNLFKIVGDLYFIHQPFLNTLSIPNGGINEIYFTFFVEIRSLNLVKNEFLFSRTTKQFKRVVGLRRLKIGHPGLRYYNVTFTGLNLLYFLRMENVDQMVLTHDVFKPIPHLLELEIDKGKVDRIVISNKKYLSSVTYSNLSNLTSISLTSCQRLNNGKISLVNLPQLKEIKIHDLGPFNFDANFFSFEGKNSLKVLNLSLNFIRDISFDVLNNFSMLEVLDLSYNKISHLGSSSLTNLTNLRYLNLSGNILTRFPFPNIIFSNLEVLNLSHNVINSLTPQFFPSISYVEICDLSFNYINSLSTVLKANQHFYMEKNTWDCICIFREDVASNHFKICPNASSTFCTSCRSSTKHSGRAVFVRANNCLLFETSIGTLVIILIPCVIGLFCVIAIVAFVIRKRKCISHK